MNKYIIEYFDSRNTSFSKPSNIAPFQSVMELGKSLSKNWYKVVINNVGEGWEEYEQGQLTSWSYPNGCGQIKINS